MNKYVVVCWPEIQALMDLEDFEENSCLINDDKLVDVYGSSAYFVNQYWLEDNEDKIDQEEEYFFRKLTKNTIWIEEPISVYAKSKEEAKLLALERFDEEFFDDVEYIYETVEAMIPKQNGGEATIELYDDEDNLIKDNSENFSSEEI